MNPLIGYCPRMMAERRVVERMMRLQREAFARVIVPLPFGGEDIETYADVRH